MALSQLAAFLDATREAPLKDADYILNDTGKRSYTLPKLVAAKPADSVVLTGDKIVEQLKLKQTSNGGEFRPGDPATVDSGIDRANMAAHWRFMRNSKPINKYQTTLNRGSDQKTVLKKWAKQIRGDLAQDHVDLMENRVWGPTVATMETDAEQTDARVVSIPTIITEQTAPVGLAGTGTLFGVNFTTYAKWDNQRYGYDSANPFGENGLLNALDYMQLLTGFVPPTGKGSEAFSPDKRNKTMIFTNLNGIVLVKKICRAGNDVFMKAGNDPGLSTVKWNDTEFMHAAVLDEALLEQSSGTAYSSAVYTAGKPRYFFVNPEFLWPCFHPEHYMNEVIKDGGITYPDTEGYFYESMWAMLCTSRRRQGLVCPSASWVTNSST